MVEWVRWSGASAVCSDCHLHPSGRVEQPNPVPLRPWPSPNRRHLLPEPHQIPSCLLCQGPPRVRHLPWRRRKQHALFSYSHSSGCKWDVPRSSARSVCSNNHRQRGVILRTRISLDQQYHTDGSILARFAWFRHKQQLHFVHHLHGDSNFAVIDFFWDRVLGTFRGPDTDAR